jgi:hypothetical protein
MAAVSLFSPLILATNLVLLLRCKIIGDVEGLADLFRRLALDHVGNGLATNVKQSLDIEIVGGKDDFKKHFLIDLHEFLVPLINICSFLTGVRVIFVCLRRVSAVMFTPLEDLLEDGLVDLK